MDSNNKGNINENKGKSFFTHPAVGIIGSSASIISIIIAAYFYIQSKEYPQLTYFTNPVKAIVVKSNQTSKLKIYYENKSVTTDITAIQIAIWNNGKRPIKKENILEPIIIRTKDDSPILEATVRKFSRKVTDFSLTLDSTDLSKVMVDWKILENNDWAIIQVIYSGNPKLDMILTGVIEGQSNIEKFDYGLDIRSTQDQIENQRNESYQIGLAFISISIFTILISIVGYNNGKKHEKKMDQYQKKLEEYKKVEMDIIKVNAYGDELKKSFGLGSYSEGVSFLKIKLSSKVIERIAIRTMVILTLLFLVGGIYIIITAKSSTLPFIF